MIDKNSEKIMQMFDKIAKKYDFFNNSISFYLHKRIKNDAVKHLNAGANSFFADLCCGTGDISKCIFENFESPTVFCADFSHSMLEIAMKNVPNATFFETSVLKTPFENNFFNYVIMAFGLRNVENVDLALFEVNRILKNDGIFLHLDFNGTHIFIKIFDFIVLFFITLFNADKTSYNYLIASIKDFLPPFELDETLENSGFTVLSHKKYLLGAIVATYAKKN